MKLTFLDFLSEEAKGKTPKYKNKSISDAIAILNTHCKNALWMLEKNSPIYRGDHDESLDNLTFSTVDLSKSTRKSEDTSNYYTEILDNIPSMTNFPKRSKSLICSTSEDTSAAFHSNLDPFIVIPFDDSKIGVVGREDIWHTKISIFDRTVDLERLNGHWSTLGYDIKKSSLGPWAFFEWINTQISNNNETIIEAVMDEFRYFKSIEKFKKEFFKDGTFLDYLSKVYGPEKTKFKVFNTLTLPKNIKNSEVWVDGKVMIISAEMWQQMRANYVKF